ncbi:hypothetical protein IFT84_20500 [Rhizobium sp. CFBP 8762]|uniref:hypothetical protein n=1 Tax=Rhizobium sp. CFBP 8762 TaxID=2775279 RepID=UPI00178593A1|nr:hypothetical protein [Rhizobium sp. CFBP 8762]MBD8556893.1 hypothetical protein [Rhizobium sp. CFBP 8762]
MKQIGIQKLLEWAFTYELRMVEPKTSVSGQSSWGVFMEMAKLGTIVDRSPSVFGFALGGVEPREPHPDAVLVGNAVRALGMNRFEIPESWNPFPDFDDPYGVIAEDVESVISEIRLSGERLTGTYMTGLVICAAIMGKGPDWRAEKPELQLVSANGKPRWFLLKKGRDEFGRNYWFEVNGYDKKRKRPMRNAYQKCELVESTRNDVLSRLDWQIWQSALDSLTASLSGRLSTYRLMPFDSVIEPWCDSCTFSPSSQAIENVYE